MISTQNTAFSEADFEKIEAEMKKIIKEDLPIERFELPRSEAIKLMKDAGEALQGRTNRRLTRRRSFIILQAR